ncbi:hypothetical protein BHE74_00042103 [Ensete ventricosum]|nr:hypothetical protein BHE74_00042103 [Ensete ventricosum]
MGARQDGPCCTCVCPPIYPPSWCLCGGVWQGSCPSACTNCECVLNECTCVGRVDAKACEADSCAGLDAAPKVEPSQQWAIEETGGKLGTMYLTSRQSHVVRGTIGWSAVASALMRRPSLVVRGKGVLFASQLLRLP